MIISSLSTKLELLVLKRIRKVDEPNPMANPMTKVIMHTIDMYAIHGTVD